MASQKQNYLSLLVTLEGVRLTCLTLCAFYRGVLHVSFYLLLLSFAAVEAALGLAVLVGNLRFRSSAQAASILY